MREFQIIVGSMLGGSEYVAEACEGVISSKNYTANVHLSPVFSEIPSENQTWLICTSTHGAGEYPDNIKAFATDLENCDQDLSTTSFAVIGIGDSNYDTFCQAAKNIENTLISKGCIKIIETKLYDMQEEIDPEEDSEIWLSAQLDQLS